MFLPVQDKRPSAALKLLVGGDSEAKAHSTWSELPPLRLEKQLDEIARAILVCAEDHLRGQSQRTYEWNVEQRERRLREQEARRRAEEAKQAALLAQAQKRQREALYAVVECRQRATEIRSLVAALRGAHRNAAADPRFASWCDLALAEADRIDPLLVDWTQLLEVTAGDFARASSRAE